MSITKEEAYNLMNEELNKWIKWNPEPDSPYWKMMQAIQMALKALLPVSRKRIEKVWRGEWIPAESDFDDDDTLFDVDDWCDWQCSACHNEVCYDDPMERRWLPKFCPNCGAPMTDEAVQMVMERLEAMKDGGT